MKCDQDLCLNLWYDLKKLLWQDELNPRVRCAFGNVYLWRCNVVDKNIGVSWTQPKAPVKTINMEDIYHSRTHTHYPLPIPLPITISMPTPIHITHYPYPCPYPLPITHTHTSDIHLYWSHSSSEEAGKLLARRMSDFVADFDDLGGWWRWWWSWKPCWRWSCGWRCWWWRWVTLGYGEEVAKEKIRCKYLPSHSHSFSKEKNLHLLESTDYVIFKALSKIYCRHWRCVFCCTGFE